MVEKSRKFRRESLSKRLVVILYFLFYTSLLFAEHEEFIESSSLVLGESFTQIVTLNENNLEANKIKLDFDNSIFAYVKDFIINKDEEQSRVEIKLSYLFDKVGFFKIPPLKVFYNSSLIYTTNSYDVIVLRKDESDFNFPIELYWEEEKSEIYKNESIGLVLRMRWLENTSISTIIEPIKSIENTIVEQVPIFSNVIYDNKNNKEVLDLPIYNWIITPLSGGLDINIPSLKVIINNSLVRNTPELNIKIKDIARDLSSHGVGDFKISYELPSSSNILANTFNVIVKITGEGNFPYLNFPKIELENAKLLYKKRNINISPFNKGYKGSIFEIYTIKPLNKGLVKVAFADWSYFSLLSKNLVDINGVEQIYNFTIQERDALKAVKRFEREVNMELLDYDEILKLSKHNFLFLIPNFHLILLPGFIIAFFISIKNRKIFRASLLLFIITFFIFNFKKAEDPNFTREDIENIIEKDNLSQTREAILELEKFTKNNNFAGLFINRAILEYKINNEFDAVYFLYKSLALSPNNTRAYDLIDLIDLNKGNYESIKTQNLSFSNFFFLISLIFLNLIIIILNYEISFKSFKVILLSTLSFLLFLSSYFVFYFYLKEIRPIGILKGDVVSLYKVPDNFSRTWKVLRGNVSVYILNNKDNFFLVETSYGLKGWVYKDFVYPLELERIN